MIQTLNETALPLTGRVTHFSYIPRRITAVGMQVSKQQENLPTNKSWTKFLMLKSFNPVWSVNVSSQNSLEPWRRKKYYFSQLYENCPTVDISMFTQK